MANTGVIGKIVDSAGKGIAGLRIVVYDVESIDRDVELGSVIATSSGDFSITYSTSAYGWLEKQPDIRIRVFDSVGRIVYISAEFPNVTDTILSMSTITIPIPDYQGWLVTLLTGTPLRVSQNLIEPQIDNKVGWENLSQDVKSATNIINALQLYLDAGNLFTVFSPPTPPSGSVTTGTRLEAELLNANKTRNVIVRLCMNDFIGLPYPVDTAGVVSDYFKNAIGHTVEVRSFQRPYNTPMHAKFFIIDGRIAHMNASPLVQEYFDDTTHAIDDPRRGKMSSPKNAIKVPVHDVGVSIQGPAIKDLDETFVIHWQHTGGTITAPVTAATPPSTNATTQVVRTLPGNLFTTGTSAVPNGEAGILEAYLRAIGNATDFIYLENQYFTERKIADALFLALQKNPNLQVIMLLNNVVDIPLYQGMQTALIRQLLSQLVSISAINRIGLFTLWTHETTPSHRIIRNYVHSKVGIVDNKWATIGSANLDGVSLILSQHIIPPITQRDELEERGIEANLVLYNDVDGLPVSAVPDELRRKLWAEHLGFTDINDSLLTTRPSGGWLSLWKDFAKLKLDSLKLAPLTWSPIRILEWTDKISPTDYLSALGVSATSLSSLTVESEVRSFDFSTGHWL